MTTETARREELEGRGFTVFPYGDGMTSRVTGEDYVTAVLGSGDGRFFPAYFIPTAVEDPSDNGRYPPISFWPDRAVATKEEAASTARELIAEICAVR